MKNAWKIKGFQRDETHRKCTQNHSGDQDRGKLEISLWLTPHVGSNPTRSAKSRETLKSVSLFLFMGFILFSAIHTRCLDPAGSAPGTWRRRISPWRWCPGGKRQITRTCQKLPGYEIMTWACGTVSLEFSGILGNSREFQGHIQQAGRWGQYARDRIETRCQFGGVEEAHHGLPGQRADGQRMVFPECLE